MTGPSCRSCRSDQLTTVLDLGDQPASDYFPPADAVQKDDRWPLVLCCCRRCHLVQLGGDAGPAPEQPLAVESATMLAHARESAARTLDDLGAAPGGSCAGTVVEFDSHHGGSWLAHLLQGGLRPADAGELADLVVDVHGLAHEPDLEQALAQRLERLSPGGRLVLEFHHLLPLVVEGQFDTVRHGHPLYLSLLALDAAFARHGLRAVAARSSPAYGGSLVVTAARRGEPGPDVSAVRSAELAAGLAEPEALGQLQERAERAGRGIHTWLQERRDEGRLVLGYGAPSKASVLLTWSGVGPELLPFTADLSPAKHGRRIAGAGIPIRSPQELVAARPDDVLILTWDIADEVRRQLAAVEEAGGRFVVPVPEPSVLGG